MATIFERPVGAAADVRELEYIAALLQTTDDVREEFVDASIDAKDIKYHLLSRHGLQISLEQVRETILAGLGGGDSIDDCLDICEIVAALFIPTLRKIVYEADIIRELDKSGKEKFDEDAEDGLLKHEFSMEMARDILEATLKNILVRATGISTPQPLTKDLIREIFAAFDENELVIDDELVTEMIRVAKAKRTADPILDLQTFAYALTGDVMRYDPTTEDRATTHYFDALGAGEAKFRCIGRDGPRGDKPRPPGASVNGSVSGSGTASGRVPRGNVTGVFTAKWLDFTAETFRSRIHVILAYVGFTVWYVQYVIGYKQWDVCDGDGFGCRVLQSMFGFTVIMALATVLGTVYFALVCMGNDVSSKSPKVVILGIIGVVIFYFAPLVIKIDLKVISTDVDSFVSAYLEVVLIVVGALLLLCQLVNVLRIAFKDDAVGSHKYMQYLVAGSNARNERSIKRAAAFKVTRMLKNAYELHKDENDNFVTSRKKASLGLEEDSTHEKALLNFTKISGKTERAGGFFWPWECILTGDLMDKEGIWIHTRIYAGIAAQFAIFIAFIVGYAIFSGKLVDYLYEEATVTERCSAVFDIADCTAPQKDEMYFGFLQCDVVVVSGEDCLDDAIVVTGDLRNISCDRFPRFYAESCDEIDFISFGSLVATATGDTVAGQGSGECKALLSSCVLLEKADDKTTVATCVVGMDQFFSPYWFWGSGCDNYFPIKEILDSRPPLLKELGDKVRTNYEKIKDEQDNLDDITPEKWMLEVCLIVGFIFGILACLLILVNYIPSTINTYLQFRTGAIPSLRDPKFIDYRRNSEDSTYIFGLMSWGIIFSAASTILIFSGITFLAVWQVTQPLVAAFFAGILGIFSTVGVKSALVVVLDKYNYAAYYRKNPAVANVLGVALECWHIAIGYAYLAIRSLMLLGLAGMNVGRVDRPFLGPGVGTVGKLTVDKFPLIYRKDILLADAHRHPYIERLALMYMMKIKNGPRFASNAGSVWRLLFVFSLMPWLRRYRITNDAYIPEGVIMHRLGLDPSVDNEENKKLKEENEVLKSELKSWITWHRESASQSRRGERAPLNSLRDAGRFRVERGSYKDRDDDLDDLSW